MTAIEAFEAWVEQLKQVTSTETKRPLYEIKINLEAAKEWYQSGCTPYQCFRENWGMED